MGVGDAGGAGERGVPGRVCGGAVEVLQDADSECVFFSPGSLWGDGRSGFNTLTDACTEEETLLIGFFGMDYVRYRDRTRVGIPFIP